MSEQSKCPNCGAPVDDFYTTDDYTQYVCRSWTSEDGLQRGSACEYAAGLQRKLEVSIEDREQAERERDEWKDIAMKEQRRSRRIAREALEADSIKTDASLYMGNPKREVEGAGDE